MEFRLLGTVAIGTETGDVPLGPAKRRSLLAALLLRLNYPLSVEQLTAALWDHEPPLHARGVIQGHVSRLRTLLTAAGAKAYGVELITQGAGYVLRMPETLLDAYRFEELVALAREQRAPADAVAMYQEALSLWQGPALADAYPSPPLQAAAHALEELRLASVEQLASGYTRLGEHARAAAVLRAEACAHPLRESLSAALMGALQRAGRRSEALDWFHRTRRLLADELGVDPGRELADAYASALRGGEGDVPGDMTKAAAAVPEPCPATTTHAPRPTPVPAAVPDTGAPDLLPRAPRGFHGRAAELVALSRAAAGETPVCLVTGPAGVGKTALVLHWAHHGRAGFPDGRLYADLRGFSDTGEPALIEVLREFLPALGVAQHRIPESANGAAALFRSLAADRRLLVVLDNARDSEQVRPLLPGGPHCVTVVTSRHRLPGLIVTDAARPVPVDVLGPEDGTALLAGVLGTERVLAEPVAARRLAELCGGLPLALRVAAARLVQRPGRSLGAMTDELSDETRRLSLLDVEDTGVQAALRLTLQQLPGHVSRQFAHLGRHPGTHVDRYAAAALAGTDPAAAEAALERLAVAHLVMETAPGRWTLHDLVRLYARGLDAGPDALKRVLDHYIATALAAVAAAEPGNEECFPLPADFLPPAAVREFGDRSAAVAWYAAERDDLTLAVAAARAAGLHSRIWRIILTLWPLIVWRVRDGWVPLLETGLEAARADADQYGEARVLNVLGWVLIEEGRSTEALTRLGAASALASRAGDLNAEANALIVLAMAQAALGCPDEAAEGCERAVELAREDGDRTIERLALQHLARHRVDAGEWRPALDTATEALAFDDRSPTADVPRMLLLMVKGEALLGLGDEAEGVRQLDLAARVAESSGYEDGAVRALGALLRVSADEGFRARYDAALARLTARP
ncbi:winged helix-turn-helix domain-containing protein [Streptomyces roseoverticillatus]|uniref:AfsR/SARP family transcriptional regulator n=1 Tax=Streptomyces roseoverticillatus TaxID=66429 RepID=UPI001F3FE8DA|nr:BTAD domain-containing putative transcriptional regulator [Streptomyces roseoverticillatus]MCF3106285.1 winged helix-turn-helix domain-containing protein [Streptomyces roseoverticillatus]